MRPELVRLLDETPDLAVARGKATLVLQIVNDRFHPSLLVRDNPTLSGSLPRKSKLIPPRAPAIPLPGATRMLIPLIVIRR